MNLPRFSARRAPGAWRVVPLCIRSLALIAGLTATFAVQERLTVGAPLHVELGPDDPKLAGYGPSRALAYESPIDGWIYVWAESERLDPQLRATNELGELVFENDDSGGGTTAFFRLEVARGQRLTVTVAAALPGESGMVRVHTVEAPETEATRAAGAAGVEALTAVRAALAKGDVELAQTLADAAVPALLAPPGAELSRAVSSTAWDFGFAAREAGATNTALAAWQHALAFRSRVLPDDQDDLQWARHNVAIVMREVGDCAGARPHLEREFASLTRTRPADHPDILDARIELAWNLKACGDLQGARAQQEEVLQGRLRTPEVPDALVQAARWELALTLVLLAEFPEARVQLEQVVAAREAQAPVNLDELRLARAELASVLGELGDFGREVQVREQVRAALAGRADDDAELLDAQQDLAIALCNSGEYDRARQVFQQVHDVYARTLPFTDSMLLTAKLNLAVTLQHLGDLSGARAIEAAVLEHRAATCADDDDDLQDARLNLGLTLLLQGELIAARELLQKVHDVYAKTCAADDPRFLRAAQNLAVALSDLGDDHAARALEEHVLEQRARALPPDHLDLQHARQNLAIRLARCGDRASARELFRHVLAVYERTRDEHDDALAAARHNLAVILDEPEELPRARELLERVLADRSRTRPADDPDLQETRLALADVLRQQRDFQGARREYELVLAASSLSMAEGAPLAQIARNELAWTLADSAGVVANGSASDAADARALRARCAELASDVCELAVAGAREAFLSQSTREAESRCASNAEWLDSILSFAGGAGVFEPIVELDREALVLSEVARAAALTSSALMRSASKAPDYAKLREELHTAGRALAAISQQKPDDASYRAAVERRDAAQRELLLRAQRVDGALAAAFDFTPDALAAHLGPTRAGVGFRRYERWSVGDMSPGATSPPNASVMSLCAFVVRLDAARSGAVVARVELGALAAIEDAVSAWREAIGARDLRGVATDESETTIAERGRALRRLVFDPLTAACGDAQRLAIALDDVLHLVALDALPLDEDGRLVGDRWHIDIHCTLAELLAPQPPTTSGGPLVAFGGASFNSEPDDPRASAAGAGTAPALRGSAWERGFTPLTYTGLEAREIAALFDESFPDGGQAVVLEKRAASRESLIERAPSARWLHIATHGWFAPESVPSWSDVGPLDAHSGLGRRMSSPDRVRGMSPMLLCGLALAGANLPADAMGQIPGLVTAEEFATLDLTNCELAVLSACDTNVGVRRAGQGVASLQKALHMAGARAVITSLWKVPDEATKELMLDFYRRLWVEKKPASVALWEAKAKLRNARDEHGAPLYSTRDWAAWVLTGDAD